MKDYKELYTVDFSENIITRSEVLKDCHVDIIAELDSCVDFWNKEGLEITEEEVLEVVLAELKKRKQAKNR
jgi:hypothetical protein